MTEGKWLTPSTPWEAMFRYIRDKAPPTPARKLQLLGCAALQLLGPQPHLEGFDEAFAINSRHADGLLPDESYPRATALADRLMNRWIIGAVRDQTTPDYAAAYALRALFSTPVDEGVQRALEWVVAYLARLAGPGLAQAARDAANQRLGGIFRELFGNPFQPRSIATLEWRSAGGEVTPWMIVVGESARALALGIQADQAFDRMPILADALEDDGCNNLELLGHLREHRTHLRGCWALDLVLGRG